MTLMKWLFSIMNTYKPKRGFFWNPSRCYSPSSATKIGWHFATLRNTRTIGSGKTAGLASISCPQM
jgi:hypothetical protein